MNQYRLSRFISIIAAACALAACERLERELPKIAKKGVLDDVAAIESTPKSDIDASALCPIFTLGSEHTDLQRERVLKEVTGKVVVWRLQVYEVRSTGKENVYNVQTQECIPHSGSSVAKQIDDMSAQILKQISKEFGFGAAGGVETNRNVATLVDLVALSDADVQRINALKTNDWIEVRGKITGSFMRSLKLSPATFADSRLNPTQGGSQAPQSGLQLSPENSQRKTVESQVLARAVAEKLRIPFDVALFIVEKYPEKRNAKNETYVREELVNAIAENNHMAWVPPSVDLVDLNADGKRDYVVNLGGYCELASGQLNIPCSKEVLLQNENSRKHVNLSDAQQPDSYLVEVDASKTPPVLVFSGNKKLQWDGSSFRPVRR